MNEKFIEELWKLVRENIKGIEELKKSQKETDRQIKELRESQKETDRQIKELRESQKETDRQIKETDRQIKETDRQLKETDRQLREKLKELGIQIGRLTDGWGKFTQGISYPSIKQALEERGFKIDYITENLKIKGDRGSIGEIDFLIFARKDGEKYVIIGEAKTSVTPRSIEKFVDKVLPDFTQNYFPPLKGIKRIGLISGIRVGTGVEKYANKKGIYILKPSGNILKVANSKNFKPKVF